MPPREPQSPFIAREPAAGGSLRLREHTGTLRVYTAAELAEIDRLADDEFGLPVLVLMENAAIGAARVALEMLGGSDRPVRVLAGAGNNGGDALAVARHLANAIGPGRVAVRLDRDPGRVEGPASIHLHACATMGLDVRTIDANETPEPALLIDGLLGTGLRDAPQGGALDGITWIARCKRSEAVVLSLDLPSGMVADTGATPGAAVQADRTATFAGLKTGFVEGGPETAERLGMIDVVPIGVPAALLARFGRPLDTGPGRSARPAPPGARRREGSGESD